MAWKQSKSSWSWVICALAFLVAQPPCSGDSITANGVVYVFDPQKKVWVYPYVGGFLQEYKPSRSLRSGDSQQLCVPRSHKAYGDKAFARFAPLAWNNLPQDLRTACSLSSFKKGLKTHFFKDNLC